MRNEIKSDPWIERLSEQLDGELDAADAAALARHLEQCAVCRDTLAELRQVRLFARELTDTPPADDLWPGIAARIAAPAGVVRLEERRARRWHISFSLPQLAAAAVVLMALSGGGVWLATSLRGGGQPTAAVELAPVRAPARLVSAESSYESAIAELQQALNQTTAPLDSSTQAVLRQSLATIDAAIADARTALQQHPSNQYLYHHLDGAMKKKVEILRRAVSARRAAS